MNHSENLPVARHAARARKVAKLNRCRARDDARDVVAAFIHYCNARPVARGRA